jgi:GDPmannose 4,6-dehydratase
MMPRALITGVTGQVGSYLAESLLEKGYEVHGLLRRSSSTSTHRIDPILDRVHLHDGDLLDGGSITRAVEDAKPDEVYNLAAQSFVPASFTSPIYTGDATGLGTARVLEAIRQSGRPIRFYQASSSEMFGSSAPPQSEVTVFRPRSPYGIAKLYAHCMTVNYREAYGLFACSGILFNHESSRRPEQFVTRKITRAVARIVAGRQDKLVLGNLDAKRDWGHARDYVRAMHLMLQAEAPDDYVIATGQTHTIREFLDVAFARVDRDWAKHVEVDPKFYRPAEVHALCGDASKARRVLGWAPAVTFAQLVGEMVDADLALEGIRMSPPSLGVLRGPPTPAEGSSVD